MHSRDLSDVESTQFTHIFPYQELEEATNGFDSKEEVGDGGFGTVYKGTLFIYFCEWETKVLWLALILYQHSKFRKKVLGCFKDIYVVYRF